MGLSLRTRILTLSVMPRVLEPFSRAIGTIVMLVDGHSLATVAA